MSRSRPPCPRPRNCAGSSRRWSRSASAAICTRAVRPPPSSSRTSTLPSSSTCWAPATRTVRAVMSACLRPGSAMVTWRRWRSSNSSTVTSMPRVPLTAPVLPPKRLQKNKPRQIWPGPDPRPHRRGFCVCGTRVFGPRRNAAGLHCPGAPRISRAIRRHIRRPLLIRILSLVLILLAAPLTAEMRVPMSQAEIQTGFVPVVRQAAPAVVNIYASRIVEGRRSPFRNDPFFGRFFNDFGASRPRVQNSLGSGVVLGADGIVVSNYHVVGEATDIRVVLNDGREYAARVLLGDEEADLAVVQVEAAPDLPALRLRDSDSVQVGELVLAIGNPFGVGQTVSSGIVSGLARSGTASGNARGYFIQTDAPINPGNSGGALVDVNGHLIGINTAILSRSGGSNGIGFAIPSDLVAQLAAQARAGNTAFARPWAGLAGQVVTPDMAEGLGLDRPEGLVISQVHPASAFDGHLAPGYVVVAVDEVPVNSPAEMVYRLSLAGIGAEATVTRLRDGETGQIEVTLIAAPEVPPRDRRVMGRAAALPGLALVTINPGVIEDYGLALGATGVLIEEPGPYGARAGLRAGDVLREIGGQETPDSAAATAALRAADRVLLLGIVRDGRRLSLRLRL